jgi:hypothetical protein
MLEPSDKPESDSELRDFESLLQQMRPMPSQLSEPELFYQAGYAAKVGVVPRTFAGLGSKKNPGAILFSFGGGVAAGVAASWVLILATGLLTTMPKESETSSFATQGIAIEQSEQRNTQMVELSPASGTGEAIMPLDWDEDSIRTVIYRGNRRAIWRPELKDESGERADSSREQVSEGNARINNLNWRRSAEESWLD